MRRTVLGCLGMALLLAARLHAAPALEPAAGGGVALAGLPPLFGRPEIREQLGTGLTTTVILEVKAAAPRTGTGSRPRGGARVDVRYELWDEVYLVTRVDAAGKVARATLPSLEKLAEWWRDQRIVVLRAPGLAAAQGPWRVDVRLRVLPFSQAEQRDAQRWLSQTLSQGGDGGSAGAASEASKDRSSSFDQVLQTLLATSIGRPALFESAWKLSYPREAGR
ncbi:MAG TPA: hypothetical protein VEL74_23880 [Thermoanaerobaculia bacterium]|nr:hypothetical protein [Thermoanaerobaculia bacterium]